MMCKRCLIPKYASNVRIYKNFNDSCQMSDFISSKLGYLVIIAKFCFVAFECGVIWSISTTFSI